MPTFPPIHNNPTYKYFNAIYMIINLNLFDSNGIAIKLKGYFGCQQHLCYISYDINIILYRTVNQF